MSQDLVGSLQAFAKESGSRQRAGVGPFHVSDTRMLSSALIQPFPDRSYPGSVIQRNEHELFVFVSRLLV